MPVVTRKSSKSKTESPAVKFNSQDSFEHLIKDFKIEVANRKIKRQAKVNEAIKSITDVSNVLIAKIPTEYRNMKITDYIENENAKIDDVTLANKNNFTPAVQIKEKKPLNAPKKAASDSKGYKKPITRTLRPRNVKSSPFRKKAESRIIQTATQSKETRAFAAISTATGKEPTKLDSRVKPLNSHLSTHLTINLTDDNSKLTITKSSGETMLIDDLSSDKLDDISLKSLREITKTLNTFLQK